MDNLQILIHCPVKAQNAGLFISRGNNALHPTRVIDSHELIFVIQGELELWEAEQHFCLTVGQTLHLFPGRKHGGLKPMPPDLKFYWIHFKLEDTEEKFLVDEQQPSNYPFYIPQTTQLTRPDALERLFRIFLSEQESGTLRPLNANLLTILMLHEVAQQSSSKEEISGLNVVATWAHTYIRMNFDRRITASKVAESLGYNVDYLGRIYREAYHTTLTEAIHHRRIQKACDYLLNSNLTINQITTACGFSDPDYFRRIFKRYMQITPNDYRDENSRLHVITH